MQTKGITKPSSSAKIIMVTARETGRWRMGRSLKQPKGGEPGPETLDPPGLGLTEPKSCWFEVTEEEEDTL